MSKKYQIALSAVLIVAVIALSAWVIGLGSKNSQPTKIENTKIKVAYLPVAQGLPFYLAIEKGYFKDAGIEVEAVKFEAPNQIIDALLSGQVQIGAPGTASGITAISQVAKPDTLKVFAIIGGDSNIVNDLLLVKKDSNIKTIEALKGKKLGILPGIQFRTIAKHILAQNKLESDKDVTIVELALPLQMPALAAGQVDALLTIEPAGTIGQAKGISQNLIKSPMVKYISDPWYGAVGDISTQYAKDNPETTKKILAVFDKAINEINTNPESTRQYLKNYTPLDDALIAKVPLPTFKMYGQISESDINSLQKFFDIFTQYNVVDKKIDTKALIYSN